jgi:hypothetical protein
MAYMCEISPNHRVYLDSQGSNTVVTMMTGGPGQQQQSSNFFQTGAWVAPPEMFAGPQGAVIKIDTAQGEYFIQLQGSSMTLAKALGIATPQPLPMYQADIPAPVMNPMQPMVMGDMQMNNNPMEMRMGNMQMRMDKPVLTTQLAQVTPPVQATQVTRKFCSQCGAAIEASDRFCSSCGHRLA